MKESPSLFSPTVARIAAAASMIPWLAAALLLIALGGLVWWAADVGELLQRMETGQ